MGKLISYECPACATTYALPPDTKRNCASCEEDIGETHALIPSVELRKRLAEIRARKAAK